MFYRGGRAFRPAPARPMRGPSTGGKGRRCGERDSAAHYSVAAHTRARAALKLPGKPQEQKDEKNSKNRGAAGKPDPAPGCAEIGPKRESIGGGKPDQPVTDRGEQQRHPRVVHATQPPRRDRLDAVGDKE